MKRITCETTSLYKVIFTSCKLSNGITQELLFDNSNNANMIECSGKFKCIIVNPTNPTNPTLNFTYIENKLYKVV